MYVHACGRLWVRLRVCICVCHPVPVRVSWCLRTPSQSHGGKHRHPATVLQTATVLMFTTSRTDAEACCRTVTSALHSWESTGRGIQQAPAAAASASATAASASATAATSTAPTKGVNIAAAAVAAAYNDKCRPAHETAVQASQAVEGVRSALILYLRQGGSGQSGLPNLATLTAVELKSAGSSYRYDPGERVHYCRTRVQKICNLSCPDPAC